MRDFLFQIGAMFLLTSTCTLIGGAVHKARQKEAWDFDDVVKGLGYAGVVTLFLPAVGLVLFLLNAPLSVAGWLVALAK